jgi:hypothetical protein
MCALMLPAAAWLNWLALSFEAWLPELLSTNVFSSRLLALGIADLGATFS